MKAAPKRVGLSTRCRSDTDPPFCRMLTPAPVGIFLQLRRGLERPAMPLAALTTSERAKPAGNCRARQSSAWRMRWSDQRQVGRSFIIAQPTASRPGSSPPPASVIDTHPRSQSTKGTHGQTAGLPVVAPMGARQTTTSSFWCRLFCAAGASEAPPWLSLRPPACRSRSSDGS